MRRPSTLQSFLANQYAQGNHDSEGTFTLSAERALAKIAGEYLKKGRSVYIEGRIQTRKWQGQDGQDRYTTEIVANEMKMLGGRGDSGGDASFEPRASEAGEPASRAPQSSARTSSPSKPDVDNSFDDDIPF